ncbi:MAG: hypothetical protein HY457_03355 [Parcubacteria group bacterium]|nr:hypothetical protein [Parcubacteria group bacterium]
MNPIITRNYRLEDYAAVAILYKDSSTYGGQFDEARDALERLQKLVEEKPDAILVAEDEGVIVGTVTLFEDGRSAWLYRFAVKGEGLDIVNALYERAAQILKLKGHTQVLVYAPVGDKKFEERYGALGFTKGHDYTAYWRAI